MTAPDASPACLRMSGLCKSFGGNRAVREMALEAAGGELVGLIGANGAGKTTVLNLACGTVRADAGTVSLRELDVTSASAARRVRMGLARTYQNPRLVERLTVVENVMLGARARRAGAGDLVTFVRRRRHEDELSQRAVDALRTVGVGETTWLKRIGEVPATDHRWIELARCLAGDPVAALLDEPTSGFTRGEVDRLAELLERFVSAEGRALVLVTHDVALAARVCGRLVVMDRGAHLADGPPDEVLRSADVVGAYLGEKAGAAAARYLSEARP